MFRLWKILVVVPLLAGWSAFPTAQARYVTLDVSLAHPALLSGAPQTTYLKVGLTGFRPSSTERRPPVNIALVLDKSGSMGGAKIAQAKEAAIQALERLDSNDIVSVVVYDNTVRIVVPATKLTDKHSVRQAIRGIQANGGTALFAGVSKGAAEVRKFLDRNRVNRVILLSDGLANVGPSEPSVLGQLGASLMKEGIAVTTLGLGLGYNEDLMFELARQSDGNHVFVEDASLLASVFDQEFNDVLSVVAQEVTIRIRCRPGVRPVRLLGIGGEISGRDVFVHLNQLYREQEKYALLEVVVSEIAPGHIQAVADVEVVFANMATKAMERLEGSVAAHFVNSATVVEMRMNPSVMEESVLQIANERNMEAVLLRDQGRIEEAKETLSFNAVYLDTEAKKLHSPKLGSRAVDNRLQSVEMDADSDEWRSTRKSMRGAQQQELQNRRAPSQRKPPK